MKEESAEENVHSEEHDKPPKIDRKRFHIIIEDLIGVEYFQEVNIR